MILKRIKIDLLENMPTNCYIIEDEITKETIVIDPAGEVDKIVEMLIAMEANLKYIYLTHCHADHSYGVNELHKKIPAKVLIHRLDYEGISNDEVNLATYIGLNTIQIDNVVRVDDGDLIHIGNLEFKVIHTPGHTKGGSSLYCEEEKMVFTGDTMFRGTWGRTDLPTGDLE